VLFAGANRVNPVNIRPAVSGSGFGGGLTPAYGSTGGPSNWGGQVDAGGSANHLPPSWFAQGSSAQWLPTGGSGQGTPGSPTSGGSGCGACDWVDANWVWIAGALVVLLIVLILIGKVKV